MAEVTHTQVSDMIIPEIFNQYFIQETVNKNAFLKSGIATSDETVNITRGGKTVNIPFYETLKNGVELLEDSKALTVHKITTNKDIAAIHARGVAYAASGLSRLFSGSDPMAAIASMLGGVWSEEFTKVIKNTLTGVFSLDSMKDSLNDQSTKVLDADIMADSMYLLGDNYDKITGLAIHSKVLARLKKLDLIDLVKPSAIELGYYTYMEKRIVVDDTLEADKSTGAYPVYFFGNGALSYNENDTLITLEEDRDKLADVDYLISRRVFTMHPRGVRWIGTPAGETPSDEELANGENWELVDNRKNVKIAKLLAKV